MTNYTTSFDDYGQPQEQRTITESQSTDQRIDKGGTAETHAVHKQQ
ncbi:hypothetical protein M514_05380 [Trichuris suis]|uniref:Uncharacterized protein n=1 Tax=Trichuris suis TaxID=68888 RepID=A0A085M8X9_9BILA|nr:hypothetical protein M513_05380 [Trichuris suis]KFD72387.1 hypothetical protein M514_05380 [Trichuris suis]